MMVKFYGYIETVKDKEFDVVFKEADDDDMMHVGTIPIDFVSEEDREYVVENNMFEWHVDPIAETNVIIFNKDMWTQEDIDIAKKRSKEFLKKIAKEEE